VLIAEKPNAKEENANENNFSILKEISDFENKITEIENNNKKFNENKKHSLKVENDSGPIKNNI